MSLDDIAGETRLSKRYLMALEDEAIAKLPGGTYNRAYLRMYATFLGLDPDPLLREYAAEEERQTNLAEQDVLATMNKAIDRRNESLAAEGRGAAGIAMSPLMAVAAAAAMIIVLGGAFWYLRSASDRSITTASAGEHAATSTALGPGPKPASPVPVPTSGVLPSSSTSPGPATTKPESAAPAEPAATPTSAPPRGEARDTTQADSASARPSDVERASHDPDATAHLLVTGSGVGTAVVDRKLIGQSDRFSTGSHVVFWTRVVGGRAGDTIDHVWFRQGSVVGAASLNVGSSDWRTQSRRVLEPPGDWVVEARDADGRVLARHEFRTADQ